MVRLTTHDIRAAAYGQEESIMRDLIGSGRMNGKHTTCAACGGTDRFRYIKSNSNFYCGGGGGNYSSGDWLELLIHMEGDFISAINRAKLILGIDDNSYDKDELRRAQLLRAEKQAKEKIERELRKSQNNELLDLMFCLEGMINKRKDSASPCDDEKEVARSIYSFLPIMYK